MTTKDTIHLFEQLVKHSHYQINHRELIEKQPDSIQLAFEKNDCQALKALFCNPDHLANKTTIFNV